MLEAYRATSRLCESKNKRAPRRGAGVLVEGEALARGHPSLLQDPGSAPPRSQPRDPQRSSKLCSRTPGHAHVLADVTTPWTDTTRLLLTVEGSCGLRRKAIALFDYANVSSARAPSSADYDCGVSTTLTAGPP